MLLYYVDEVSKIHVCLSVCQLATARKSPTSPWLHLILPWIYSRIRVYILTQPHIHKHTHIKTDVLKTLNSRTTHSVYYRWSDSVQPISSSRPRSQTSRVFFLQERKWLYTSLRQVKCVCLLSFSFFHIDTFKIVIFIFLSCSWRWNIFISTKWPM